MTLECLRLWKFQVITPTGRSVYNFGFYVKGPTKLSYALAVTAGRILLLPVIRQSVKDAE